MKNLKQNIILCIGIILTGLIAACSNPYTVETVKGPAISNVGGTGNVLIRIADSNNRTILPAADGFSRYELEVAAQNGTPIAVPQDLSGITGSGVSMTLAEGTYTITVKAYRGDNLAAKGSKTEALVAGSTISIAIELKPFISSEVNGFFSYDITLPTETVSATLQLKSIGGSYDQSFNLKTNHASSAPIELAAGYYEIIITLTNNDDETGDYHVVHIYSGMETKAQLNLAGAFALINLDALEEAITAAENALARQDVILSDDGEDVLVGKLWTSQAAIDALNTALTAAKDIVENPPDRQKPVNQAQMALQSALTTFGPHNGKKDVAPLQQLIAGAESAKANILTSDDGTDIRIVDYWVTGSVMNALNTALAAAQAIVADPSSKQPAVVTAQQTLQAALDAFVPQLGTKDLRALSALIAEVETELASANISVDGSDVSIVSLWVAQDAVDALAAVLEEAEAIVNNNASKQPAVVAVQQALEAALATFKSKSQSGTKFDGAWSGRISNVETPVTFTFNSASNGWTLSVPLLNTTVNGTYTVSNGTIALTESGDFAAGALPSVTSPTLTLNLTNAILGVTTVTLTEGTITPAADIEYLYSGIWTDTTGAIPALTYISSSQWTFSLPYSNEKVNGSFRVYDRKAAFVKTDGTVFAVAKLATEEAGFTGNILYYYPLGGGSYTLKLNPYPNPFINNWQGGDTISGTLYAEITTWSLGDVSGEYIWDGDNTVYFISNGTRYATGSLNGDKKELTFTTTAGDTQVFTLIASPFIGNWKGAINITVILFPVKVADVTAAVTSNAYDIYAAMTSTAIAAGLSDMQTNGQYYWKTVGSTRTAYFFSNGYPYGTAALSTNNNTITVTLSEPLSNPIGADIKTITLTRQ